MNIRSASFRDLAGIEQLYREVAARDHETPIVANSPVPEAALLRLWYVVSKSLSSRMPLTDGADVLYVAEEGQEIIGFIQAQSIAGKPKSWQIVNLCVASGGHGHFAQERLLTSICNRGLESGVQRLHVRLPLDHPLVTVFIEHGFSQFATEQILFRDEVAASQAPSDDPALRPARRDDITGLHLLYLRTTPSQVASIEAPTQKSWQQTYANGVLSRLGRDDVQHIVAERSGIYGWAFIRPATGTQPTVLNIMCEGHDSAARERFIDAVMAALPPGPTTSVLRHYDSELIRALQQRGFAVYGTQLLLVRDLAAKVKLPATKRRKKTVLMPAGIARSAPVPQSNPLRVLTTEASVEIQRRMQ